MKVIPLKSFKAIEELLIKHGWERNIGLDGKYDGTWSDIKINPLWRLTILQVAKRILKSQRIGRNEHFDNKETYLVSTGWKKYGWNMYGGDLNKCLWSNDEVYPGEMLFTEDAVKCQQEYDDMIRSIEFLS